MSSLIGLRVLLVGCPADLVRAVRAGGHAAVAADAPAAVRRVEAAAPEVVLLDLEGVPGGDWRRLARDLRAEATWPRPMFVALAGGETPGLEAECRAAGIDLLVFRPVSARWVTDFLDRLSSVSREYREFDPAI